MTTHLYRREGGTYYFRRAIPEALRPQFGGKREWIKSLATKDRRQAKRLLPLVVAAFDEAMEGQPIGRPFQDATAPIERTPIKPIAPTERLSKPFSVPLMQTFEAYAAEQGIKPSTASEWRSMLAALVAFIGHDDAASLTEQEIDHWRDALLVEPGRGGKRRSPGTVKGKYLCALRATLAWAVEKRLITKNVALNVKVRVPKKIKARDRDFTHDEALIILKSSRLPYPSCNEYDRLARRWIPWLCAYTGARVNEISQLRGSDVEQLDGIWTIRITPEAGTVKNGEARHERLRDWIRLEVGITDLNVQPNHGWRHTFKTRAIDAGIPERIADAIQGHAPRSVGQSYGAVSLQAKRNAIEAMPRFVSAKTPPMCE